MNTRVVNVSLWLVSAAVAIASFLPGARLWGINHLAFYPLSIRIPALALIALCFFPRVADYLYAFFLSLTEDLTGMDRRRSTIVIGVTALAAAIAFWVFRSSTNLWGDGQLIEQSFDAVYTTGVNVIMRSPIAILHEEHIAPGATMVYFYAAEVAKALGSPPGTGIRMLNCLLGGGLVFVILKGVRDAPLAPAMRVWFLVLAALTTTLELFFGYMEFYAPLVFVLALYVISCVRALRGEMSRVWPIFFFALATFMHIQGCVFFASLVYVVLRARAGETGKERLRRYGFSILATLTVLTTFALWQFTSLSEYFLPLRASTERTGVITPSHLIDVANELMLMLPALPVVLAMLWRTRGAGGEAWHDKRGYGTFIALMLFPCGIYLLLFNPEIGMARDWDLFAMTTVALVPLAMLAMQRFVSQTGRETVATRVAVPTLVMTVVLSVSWYGLHAAPMRSAERFERVVSYDESHFSYALETLASFYDSYGDVPRAINIMERATEISPNPRLFLKLAVYYERDEKPERAIDILMDVARNHPDYYKARFKLVSLLEAANRWDDVIEVSREGTVQNPDKPIFYFYLGESLIRTGQIDEGLAWLRKCRTLNPPEGALEHIADRLKQFGQQ